MPVNLDWLLELDLGVGEIANGEGERLADRDSGTAAARRENCLRSGREGDGQEGRKHGTT